MQSFWGQFDSIQLSEWRLVVFLILRVYSSQTDDRHMPGAKFHVFSRMILTLVTENPV